MQGQELLAMDQDNRLQDQSIKLYQGGVGVTQYVTERLCVGAKIDVTKQFQGTVAHMASQPPENSPLDWMGALGFRYDPTDYVLTGLLSRSSYRHNPQTGEEPRTADLAKEASALSSALWHNANYNFNFSYAHKVVDKEMQGGNSIWFAADYTIDPDAYGLLTDKAKRWAPGSKASLGYMIALATQGVRQSTIKGKVDTDGTVSGVVEEQVNPMVAIVMSAALDHSTETYRFGFGMQVGS